MMRVITIRQARKDFAGAMGYLHKIGRPSVGMRLALAMKDISVDDLDNMSSMVIDVMEIEEKSKRVC